MKYGPYHRFSSPEEVRQIRASGEIWGSASRNVFSSDIPKVKAYAGKLPADGPKGIEFETDVQPDHGHVPTKPTWSAQPNRAGVVCDGEYAKIKVRLRRQNVIS